MCTGIFAPTLSLWPLVRSVDQLPPPSHVGGAAPHSRTATAPHRRLLLCRRRHIPSFQPHLHATACFLTHFFSVGDGCFLTRFFSCGTHGRSKRRKLGRTRQSFKGVRGLFSLAWPHTTCLLPRWGGTRRHATGMEYRDKVLVRVAASVALTTPGGTPPTSSGSHTVSRRATSRRPRGGAATTSEK